MARSYEFQQTNESKERDQKTENPLLPEVSEGETQEAGIKVLSDTSRELAVAVHAGDRYSRQTEAARVEFDIEYDMKGNARAACLRGWLQAEFAAESGALSKALDAAEVRLAQRGVRLIQLEIPERELGLISGKDYEKLESHLQDRGYVVETGQDAGRDQGMKAWKRLSFEQPPPIHVRLPVPEADSSLGAEARQQTSPVELPAKDEPVQDLPEEDTPLEKEISTLVPRFENEEQIQSYVENSLYQINQTRSGRRFINALPEDVTLRCLVEAHPEKDMLTCAVALAQDARLGPTASGSLVHRISELRQLHHHPREILRGQRLTEQSIEFVDSGGEKHRVELDTVIVRGENHYIRDNKPIALNEFEDTPAGTKWAEWMQENFGPNFRQKIRMGQLNPFAQTESGHMPMEREPHRKLKEFLSHSAEKHCQQIETYRQHYAAARGVPLSRVIGSVRPYFTYR